MSRHNPFRQFESDASEARREAAEAREDAQAWANSRDERLQHMSEEEFDAEQRRRDEEAEQREEEARHMASF